jgi:hypothetical protein
VGSLFDFRFGFGRRFHTLLSVLEAAPHLRLNSRISNRDNFESTPNITDANDLHLEKQPLQITSTDEEM